MEPTMRKNESEIKGILFSALDAPVKGRLLLLQVLARHFLTLIGSSFPSTIEKYIDELNTAILDRLDRFNGLSQSEKENTLEDCVVFLFGKICDNGKKTVLVEDVRDIYNFCGADIVQQLRNNGFNAWTVLTHSLEINEQQLPIDKRLLEKMNYISLILSAPRGFTLDHNHCTKTFELPFSPSIDPDNYCILKKDFFYVPNHSVTEALFKKYKNACPLPPDLIRHRRKFTAIPVGNVKMLRMRKLRQQIPPEKRNRILFCSEALDYPNSIVEEYGIQLIRRILDRFPASVLAYRPHPKWADHPITLKLRESFASEARFEFDTNKLSEEIIASGCALITDGSLSGLTYCLASSRPSIYINPQVAHFNSRVLGIKFEDGALFRFCSSVDEAVNALQDLVLDPCREFGEISELSDKAFAHPYDSHEYLLSSIKAIVNNETLPDWKSLEISEDEVGDKSAASYVGFIRNAIVPFYNWPSYVDTNINEFPQDVKSRIVGACKYEHDSHLVFSINLFGWVLRNFRKYGFSQFTSEVASGIMKIIFKRGDANEVGAAVASLRDVTVKIMHNPHRRDEAHRLLSWFRAYLSNEIQLNPRKYTEQLIRHWRNFDEATMDDKSMVVFDLADALLKPPAEMGCASDTEAINQPETIGALVVQEFMTLCCEQRSSAKMQLRANFVPLLSQTLAIPYFPDLSVTVGVGDASRGIAFDGTNLWVANSASNSVTKINPVTAKVVNNIACGPSPHSLAFDGAHMWLTNAGANTVQKIDVATDVIVANVTVGSVPTGIAFDGACMWVANNGSNALSKIDIATCTVLAAVAVSEEPFGVCFDGTHIWNSTYNIGFNTLRTSVDKVDIATNTRVATITVAKQPHSLAFDGAHIWVASLTGRSLSKIDISTNTVVASVALNGGSTGIAFDGKFIWVAEHSRGISKVDTAANAIVYDMTISSPNIEGLAFDGTYVWFGNNRNNVVQRILA